MGGQLSAHLRSLRKSRGLNQVQLGAMLGVEQFMALLGALGVHMVFRPGGPASVAGATPNASGGTPSRPALTRRRPLGEPW